jgi:hypothetical protein
VGYEHPEVDIRTVSIGDGCSEIVQTPIIKKYPPSEVACIFWLKNRQPKKWRDKQDVSISNPDGTGLLDGVIIAMAQASARKLNQGGAVIPVESEKLS